MKLKFEIFFLHHQHHYHHLYHHHHPLPFINIFFFSFLLQNASFRIYRVLSLPEILDRWLLEQGKKRFLQSPQKIQEMKMLVKPISKYFCVLKRVAHVLSKGTLHWKDTLHLEHAARQSREKLYSTWQS